MYTNYICRAAKPYTEKIHMTKKQPKIKHSSLINTYKYGGLKNVDILYMKCSVYSTRG